MPAVTPESFAWQDLSACRGEDPELFFGAGYDESPEARAVREAKAKRVCARCPVISDCLGHAIGTGTRHGVWGGLGEDERASYRRTALRRREGKPA
jgi:WhiB family redox-sensing transcriptional regulator